MPTQTGSIDLASQKAAHDAAAQVATNYVTDLTNGAFVHPEGDTSNGVQITNKVEIIRGGDSVAEYGDTVRIGESGDTHISMDYHSMEMLDKDGNIYFEAADLRNSSGIATVTETFIADGETVSFPLGLTAIVDPNYTVTVSDSSGGTVTRQSTGVGFSAAPTEGATITVTFTTQSADAKAYTLGARGATGGVGASSAVIGSGAVASGFNTVAANEGTAAGNYSFAANTATAANTGAFAIGNATATGVNSFAGGDGSTAHGDNSFAFGDGINANGGFVIGAYNASDPYGDALFTIGDGGDDNDRSNALHVAYGGELEIGGDIRFGKSNPNQTGVSFLNRFYTKRKYPTSGGQPQTTTVAGGATKWVTVDCSDDEGILLCPCGYYINGTTMLLVYAFYQSSSYECSVALKNTGTSSVTATIEVACLYAKYV